MNAVASCRQQIAELKEFNVTYQEKIAELLKGQQEEIHVLQKQLVIIHFQDNAKACMPVPLKFNGGRHPYRAFLNQCRIYSI